MNELAQDAHRGALPRRLEVADVVLGDDPGGLLLAGQRAHVQLVMRGGVVFAGVEEVVEVAGVVEVAQHVAVLKIDAVRGFGRLDELGHERAGVWNGKGRVRIERHAERSRGISRAPLFTFSTVELLCRRDASATLGMTFYHYSPITQKLLGTPNTFAEKPLPFTPQTSRAACSRLLPPAPPFSWPWPTPLFRPCPMAVRRARPASTWRSWRPPFGSSRQGRRPNLASCSICWKSRCWASRGSGR